MTTDKELPELAEAVRRARKELGLSQGQLCAKAGIQPKQLATLEQGRNVTLRTLRKVLAQLPNLKAFTLGGVHVETDPAHAAADEQLALVLWMQGLTLIWLTQTLRAGTGPTPSDLPLLDRVNTIFLRVTEIGGR